MCHGGIARAAEDDTAARDSSTIGVAAGILPPPGVYGSLETAHSFLTVKSSDGGDTPSKVVTHGLDAGVLWVPDVKILGASYGVGLSQPLREQSLTTSRAAEEAAGTGNTVLNLYTFSWNLGRGFHASLGANLFIDDVAYKVGKLVNIGRNFTTYEPRAALTSINGNWAVTGSVMVDLNTENRATRSLSGNALFLDVTAVRYVGRWEFGLGSELLQQISADRRDGIVVPAMPSGHARGNRARNVSLGPVAGYDFDKFDLQAYYQKSVSAANVAAGFEVGLRATFPITTSGNVAPHGLDGAGKR